MGRKNTTPARLECPECGYVAEIRRKSSKLKKAGHVKHMWCPVCEEVRGFVEIGEWE